ncbi:zinc-binding dehydrogenase [Streptacidiphilus sp. ASG 303]|uniref:quinone oxidoreductase family protein n=1 Tax=Streptacidiphilus sp. ASG 303 TaxID=2896847 RepID=UPI001E40B63F|nr:zinc-binding dehydrogenase [Streptacidiphilus sp. ASG 303]MCD0484854.1 zinc-binding dehydrogenase [Streptacidiphilus sp. ASG 303]
MHAMTISEFGGPQVLVPVDLPDPRPGAGQISIDTSHAAVGLVDVFFRRGDLADRPGFPRPPFVPGLEVAGTVRELGEGVTGFQVGEPVVTLSRMSLGGYATVTLAEAAMTVSLKGSGVDPAQAVAVLPNAVTAHLALTRVAHLREGESVLVHGAAGGLAAAFPAVARSLGASRITGTVTAQARIADTAHLDYDEVLTSDRFVAALDGRPVDVVVDPVGGEVRTASLDVLAPLGRILLLGHAARTPDTPVTGDELWGRNAGMLGFAVGPYLQADPSAAQPAAAHVIALLADGRLTRRIDELPLAEAAEAHRRLEAREVPGRIVLTT